MTILIVLLVSDFLMVYPAYSQEGAASTTTIADSGPSQQETTITIKIVVFLICCYVG